MSDDRKTVKCPKADTCPKFCTHKAPHLQTDACYPRKADTYFADPNCPDCAEVI